MINNYYKWSTWWGNKKKIAKCWATFWYFWDITLLLVLIWVREFKGNFMTFHMDINLLQSDDQIFYKIQSLWSIVVKPGQPLSKFLGHTFYQENKKFYISLELLRLICLQSSTAQLRLVEQVPKLRFWHLTLDFGFVMSNWPELITLAQF